VETVYALSERQKEIVLAGGALALQKRKANVKRTDD
jgi:hypothetical protein